MSLSEQFTNLRTSTDRMAQRYTSSIDDLSDTGTERGRMGSENYAKNDQASFLVKALKDFIIPIINTQAPGLAANQMRNTNDNIQRPQLRPVAQQLIDALENFIASLMSPHQGGQGVTQTMEARNIGDNRVFIRPIDLNVGKSQSIPRIFQSFAITAPRSRLQKLVLDAAKNRVFNRMPIRLLAFDSHGSGISVLDRSAVWDRISPWIEAGFNENQMNMDIMRRSSSDAEKEAIEDFISLYTRYAIMSHCWIYEQPGEVTYGDWKSKNFDINSLGYQKLAKFCKVAAEEHGITLAWMDTVCINKDSSAELDESIRSMFKWYHDASICITYLAHTATPEDMRNDAWFTRGWTLQELLAPRRLKFYGADWQRLSRNSLNDKEDYVVQNEILATTTITSDELNYMASATISRKMQWAAHRQVTREEDTAYSLMGIFNVSISIAYGEGAERAFFRLLQQILTSGGRVAVQGIMNWGYGPDVTRLNGLQFPAHSSSLIPSSPQQYLWRTKHPVVWVTPSVPLSLSHLGLHLSVLLMPASLVDSTSQLFQPFGNYYGDVTIDEAVVFDISNGSSQSFNPRQRYSILDSSTNGRYPRRHPITFGVLNFTTSDEMVALPLSADGIIYCFAVGLVFGDVSPAHAAATKTVSVLRSQTSIAFELHQRQPMVQGVNRDSPWHVIPKTDLARHGMQMLDMYL